MYGDLAHYLGQDQPVYGLQCQGLDGQQEYLTTVEAMAQHYIKEIRTVQPQGPYLLGGFCLGGFIAFEMAQQLAQDGQETGFLGLFDAYYSSELPQAPSVKERLSHLTQKVQFHWANLAQLGTRDRFAYFGEKVKTAQKRELARLGVRLTNFSRRLNPVNKGKRPELFLEDFNETVGLSYRPKAYAGKATLFRPSRNYAFYQDPLMGWGNLVRGGLEIVDLPVNPGGMFVEPYVQAMAAKLKEELEKSQHTSPRKPADAFSGCSLESRPVEMQR
jgi:aspartate racemase